MKNALLKSTSVVGALTLLSRIMGFIRDLVFAHSFGAGAAFDAYVVANKIPNFLRRLFAEGAFSQAFVPVLAQFKGRHDATVVEQFIARVSGTLGLLLIVITLLAQVFAPLIVLLFAPGFFHDPTRLHLATHMLHITFPYLALIGMTALCGAVQNSYGHFAVPALTPVLLNVALILVALCWAPFVDQPVVVLAWGVLIGGVLQLMFQLPVLYRLGLLPKPQWGWRDVGVRRVMRLMVPALFGVSVAQVGVLIDNGFASFLPTGGISWLYYSDRLIYFPTGVVGVALATVVLPLLSRYQSLGQGAKYTKTLDWAMRCVVLVGLPCAVGLWFAAGPILSTLIQHGRFTPHDLVMTQKSLRAFSIGLPGFMAIKVLASGFYSQQNIKTPVKVAACATALNIVLNLLLIHSMAHAGLALATSLASLVNALVLGYLLVRQGVWVFKSAWYGLLARLVVANGLMAAALWWVSGPISLWMQWTPAQRAGHLLVVMLVAVAAYTSALWLLGLRPKQFSPP